MKRRGLNKTRFWIPRPALPLYYCSGLTSGVGGSPRQAQTFRVEERENPIKDHDHSRFTGVGGTEGKVELPEFFPH